MDLPTTFPLADIITGPDIKNALLVLLVIVLVFFRLMRKHQISVAFLIVVPAVLIYFGIDNLKGTFEVGEIVILSVSIVVEIFIGLWLGTTYRMWRQPPKDTSEAAEEEVWLVGTRVTLFAWLVAFGLRFVASALGYTFVDHYDDSSELLLSLAATFIGQNIVLAQRGGLIRFGDFFSGQGPPPGVKEL